MEVVQGDRRIDSEFTTDTVVRAPVDKEDLEVSTNYSQSKDRNSENKETM